MNPQEYAVRCSAIALNIYDGMQDAVGTEGDEWMQFIGGTWGKGFVELTELLGRCAVIAVGDMIARGSPQHPGVYEYEVAYEFGMWLAPLIGMPGATDEDVLRRQLVSMADVFFAQECNKEMP